jgi:hypothetical protein
MQRLDVEHIGDAAPAIVTQSPWQPSKLISQGYANHSNNQIASLPAIYLKPTPTGASM